MVDGYCLDTVCIALNSNASDGRSKTKRIKSFIILEIDVMQRCSNQTWGHPCKSPSQKTSQPHALLSSIARDPELRAPCHLQLLQSNISYHIPFSNSHKNNTWIISFASTKFILHDFSKRLQYYSVRTHNIATSGFDFLISSHYGSNSFFLLPVKCIAS